MAKAERMKGVGLIENRANGYLDKEAPITRVDVGRIPRDLAGEFVDGDAKWNTSQASTEIKGRAKGVAEGAAPYGNGGDIKVRIICPTNLDGCNGSQARGGCALFQGERGSHSTEGTLVVH